jgi:phage terminase Nu1 subunit (DNA packaging protein)
MFCNCQKNPIPLMEMLEQRELKYRPITKCQFQGCQANTHKGKPYCEDHILELGYAQKISNLQSQVSQEIDRVIQVGSRAISKNSLMVQDIIRTLEIEKELSIDDLAKEVGLRQPKGLIHEYLRQLGKWGLVVFKDNIVSLVEDVLMGTDELAQLTGLHPRTIRTFAKKMGAPHSKSGGDLRFSPKLFGIWYQQYREDSQQKRSAVGKKRQQKTLRRTVKKGRSIKDTLVTTKELAALLGVSEAAIDVWVEKGVPHHKIGMGRLRMFDPDEVKVWHQEHLRLAAIARKKQGYGEEFWQEVADYAKKHGISATKDQYSYVHYQTILKKIRKYGVIPTVEAISHRTKSIKDAAADIGLKAVTVHRWTSQGAPHDRVLRGKKEIILVDVDELKKWAEGRRYL